MNTKYSTYFEEFKKSKSAVVGVAKSVFSNNLEEDFKKAMESKIEKNKEEQLEFLKIRQDDFLNSVDSIKEASQLTEFTTKYIKNLCIQLKEYDDSVKAKISHKQYLEEKIKKIKTEIKANKVATILFAYLNKARNLIEDGQFDESIQLIDAGISKYQKYFSPESEVFLQSSRIATELKQKVMTNLQMGMNTWLSVISREQYNIGRVILEKAKMEARAISTGRPSQTVMNSVRKTQNIAVQMNKTSLLKSSLLGGEDNFDVMALLSAVDMNFLVSAFNTSSVIEGSVKMIEFVSNSRNEEATHLGASKTIDSKFVANIIGFITIQLSISEALSEITKQKFEDSLLVLINESVSSISVSN